MTATIILCLILGWLAYWIAKVPSTIVGSSAVNTVRDFYTENWKPFFVSLIGLVFVCIAGGDIPEDWGKITGPFPALVLGGSIPSIFMNLFPLSQQVFSKKH